MKFTAIALAATLAIPGALSAQEAQGYAPQADLVQTAAAAGSFETLAKALEAAGLVETLKGEGPFTVFAPTDEAFAKLPAGALDSLLADREKLVQVLTYHVVPGRVGSSDVAELSSAATVNGKSLRIAAADGKVKVDDATVIQADVAASNGVIHVIDTVLLPE
ncbi:MAG TPA: fasciclin domain-containing protein [Gemmatimonadales bacterium]